MAESIAHFAVKTIGLSKVNGRKPCSLMEAARLLGLATPPLQSVEQAGLSPAARAFYAENRRVANGKAKRLLGWKPRHPTYSAGLRAIRAAEHLEQV